MTTMEADMTEQTEGAEVACACVENIQRYADYTDLVMRDCPAHPYYRTPCTATFEPVAANDRGSTHTCTLGGGHDGPHFCSTCRSEWDVSLTARAAVVAARGAEDGGGE